MRFFRDRVCFQFVEICRMAEVHRDFAKVVTHSAEVDTFLAQVHNFRAEVHKFRCKLRVIKYEWIVLIFL